MNVKLWILTRQDTPQAGEVTACVIAMPTEKEARELANQESQAEGYVWTDGSLVEANLLAENTVEGVEGVVCVVKE